ncbi:MAG: thiamine phosphate synthase [Rhodanobacteraceae bacterium]
MPYRTGPSTKLRTGPSTTLRTGLYAITDGPRDDLTAAARAALGGGAAMLQYRDKTRDRDRRLQEARALAALCDEFSVPLILNDDLDLARASRAAGVHLGEDDATITDARRALGPGAIIGVSCYDSLERARSAAAAGADYLAFGAFFPTSTKSVTRRATTALLREAKDFGLPLVAIGGITPDNGGPLVAAGADYLAAISGVFGAADIQAATRRYAQCFQPRIDTDKHG